MKRKRNGFLSSLHLIDRQIKVLAPVQPTLLPIVGWLLTSTRALSGVSTSLPCSAGPMLQPTNLPCLILAADEDRYVQWYRKVGTARSVTNFLFE